MVWLTVGAIVVGLVASIAALAGDDERVATYWTLAQLSFEGDAQITEVLDYDFGVESRHGIFRDIPSPSPVSEISVSSPTAPDQFTLEWTGSTLVRIGDPALTVSGRHRYTIQYPLSTLVDGTTVAWNAVGLEWEVPVTHTVAHLVAPYELTNPRCDRGTAGSTGGCTATQIKPGHLIVDTGRLEAGEGVTIYATAGPALPAMPTLPAVPSGEAEDPGSGLLLPGVVAMLATLAGGLIVSPSIRRHGRELAYAGGAADAALGDDSLGVRQVDYAELDEMATTDFAPPADLSAALGGVIHSERPHVRHRVAWLIESAIRDEVALSETDEPKPKIVLARGPKRANPAVEAVLDTMFAQRDSIELGTYDASFTAGWNELDERLDDWRASSDLWDQTAGRRVIKARVLGSIIGLLSLALVAAGAFLANRWAAGWLGMVAIAALIAGAGFSAVIRSWELRVRSPKGTALWLQIESFRRFIENSEAYHAKQAAERGYLREYTAWAVALDELDHWNRAVESAAKELGSNSTFGNDLAFAAAIPALSSSAMSAGTPPSSSGGGGGGGGGGSW